MNAQLRPHGNLDAGQVIEITANLVINLFAIIGLGTVGIGLGAIVLTQAEVTLSESPPPPPPFIRDFHYLS